MSTLQNKIDFVALISVNMANANGDPLNGNRPRTDYNNYGEISDVCIKRKIRNRMQDQGYPIFVQSEDRCDDGLGSLSERASTTLKGIKNREEYTKKACETWLDVRAFGQVFAFKSKDSVSAGVRGPVSIHQAVSISPVDVQTLQITKSVNGDPGEKRSSDTMGNKHFVPQGSVPETVREHYASLPHHAGECISCGACEQRCPFHVAIVENMRQAKEVFKG